MAEALDDNDRLVLPEDVAEHQGQDEEDANVSMGSNEAASLHEETVRTVGGQEIDQIPKASQAAHELARLMFPSDDEEAAAEQVDMLLSRNPELCKEKDSYGATPLHKAIENQAPLAAINRLVSCYPRALVEKKMDGATPLLVACRRIYRERDEIYEPLTTAESARIPYGHDFLPLHMYLLFKKNRAWKSCSALSKLTLKVSK